MTTDKQALLAAVNDLVKDPDPGYKLAAMDAVSALRRNYPVVLSGELRVLNPLLGLRTDEPEKYGAVQELIDQKREELGFKPCWPEPEATQFDKVECQRQLMAKRRARSGRAVDIENAQRGEKDRLIGNARLEFERVTLANWGERVRQAVENAKTAAGGKLPKKEQDAIRDAIWRRIDEELDEREEAIRRELLKPVHQRQKV